MGVARDRQTSGARRAGGRGGEIVEESVRFFTLIRAPSAIALLLLASLLSGALALRAGQQPRMDPDVAAANQAAREGRKADEERILTAALEKAKREARESARVVLLLNHLGGLYAREGRYEEAEKAHESGLAISTKLYGPDDPRLIAELNNLAELTLGTKTLTKRRSCTSGLSTSWPGRHKLWCGSAKCWSIIWPSSIGGSTATPKRKDLWRANSRRWRAPVSRKTPSRFSSYGGY